MSKNKIILYGVVDVLKTKPSRMALRTGVNLLLIDRPEWLDDSDNVKIIIQKIKQGGEIKHGKEF